MDHTSYIQMVYRLKTQITVTIILILVHKIIYIMYHLNVGHTMEIFCKFLHKQNEGVRHIEFSYYVLLNQLIIFFTMFGYRLCAQYI